MTVVDVSVSIDCAECESKIRRSLLKLKGVHDVEVDRIYQRVRVLGSVDQKRILKAIRKSTGKRAVLCIFPHNPQYHAQHPEYYNQFHAIPAHRKIIPGKMSTYNYHVHGYDTHHWPGNYNDGAASTLFVSDKAHYFFSDDNPTACSIM
ncbi:Heavy metal transport/detoxification superfamily protein [Rhynchospora pubera]|uniref:Heavy metal transport/detoxification superfamily protein n=1 Tax=Rhynchospora pubera TaxID=906938 RepID=A0AAV8DU28_9POAL|nr:Heavy metal transport/detoxification superfamily protein [Rhynchospora pubera]